MAKDRADTGGQAPAAATIRRERERLQHPDRIRYLEPSRRTVAALMAVCNTDQTPAVVFIQEWGWSGDLSGW